MIRALSSVDIGICTLSFSSQAAAEAGGLAGFDLLQSPCVALYQIGNWKNRTANKKNWYNLQQAARSLRLVLNPYAFNLLQRQGPLICCGGFVSHEQVDRPLLQHIVFVLINRL